MTPRSMRLLLSRSNSRTMRQCDDDGGDDVCLAREWTKM
jgi:hypothetical protein